MAANEVALQLFPCKVCGRSFVKESLAKHQNACQKVSKPRKVFDSSKQRVTEDLPLRQIKNAQKKSGKDVVQPPKSNWRAKHEDFVNSIRAARDVTKAQMEGRPLPPPPPPSINPDYEQCPYCDRRFNRKAAERHIPFCKEQSLKKGPLPPANKAAANKGKFQPPKPKSNVGAAGRGAAAPPPGNRPAVGRAGAADIARTGLHFLSPPPPSDGLPLNKKKPLGVGCVANRDTSVNQVNKIASYQMRAGAKHPLSPIGQISHKSKSNYHLSSKDSVTKHCSSRNSNVPAKFCHNCGTQYYVTTAKFCCECGISRIGIS
ncbi:zinc finger C2HC domain-containing protein 1B-like isoform X4 [Gigantopelta aegis]|uniref:zinc finger C2HC domain-containing protein 1B-like isoform X4 n=1 Tax=Gigantopelta aegis TaxID=1735272 RepID=UPI001B8896A7|nr:zinc finger C2HC domain-containing protein 1B-like isoform X4 [Gigantopelta aegis]